MKTSKLNKTLLALITLATASYANAQALNLSEINNVRGVLRALNVDESQLSNADIESLREQGNTIRSYEKSKQDYLRKSKNGEVYRTCGAGSHGGSNDPV